MIALNADFIYSTYKHESVHIELIKYAKQNFYLETLALYFLHSSFFVPSAQLFKVIMSQF